MPAGLLMDKSSAAPPAAPHPAPPPPPPPADKPRSAAAEHRKSSKPIMEKRRRARINESLAQLKSLILDALKKDSSRHSKLEKADILEMTVKHLRNLQRAQMTAALNTDPSVLGKYRAGFSECVNEVTRFLSTCEGVNTEVRTRLLGHLAGCMGQINAMNYPAPPPPQQQQPPPSAAPPGPGASSSSFGQPLLQIPAGTAPPAGSLAPCKLGGTAGDGAKVYGGFQLVPASDGQFAFLIPSASFAPPHGGALIPLYSSGGLGSGLPPPALSPAAALPSLPADSVWRPW